MEVSSGSRGVNDQREAMAVMACRAQKGLPYSLMSGQAVQMLTTHTCLKDPPWSDSLPQD